MADDKSAEAAQAVAEMIALSVPGQTMTETTEKTVRDNLFYQKWQSHVLDYVRIHRVSIFDAIIIFFRQHMSNDKSKITQERAALLLKFFQTKMMATESDDPDNKDLVHGEFSLTKISTLIQDQKTNVSGINAFMLQDDTCKAWIKGVLLGLARAGAQPSTGTACWHMYLCTSVHSLYARSTSETSSLETT